MTEHKLKQMAFEAYCAGYGKGHNDTVDSHYALPEDYPEEWDDIYQDLFVDQHLSSPWIHIFDEDPPQDGSEFLVKNSNQGGVKTLVSWNIVHEHWQSKGKYYFLHDHLWIPIPE